MPQFTCPHCGQLIDAEDAFAGMDADCPTCEEPVTVPVLREPPRISLSILWQTSPSTAPRVPALPPPSDERPVPWQGIPSAPAVPFVPPSPPKKISIRPWLLMLLATGLAFGALLFSEVRHIPREDWRVLGDSTLWIRLGAESFGSVLMCALFAAVISLGIAGFVKLTKAKSLFLPWFTDCYAIGVMALASGFMLWHAVGHYQTSSAITEALARITPNGSGSADSSQADQTQSQGDKSPSAPNHSGSDSPSAPQSTTEPTQTQDQAAAQSSGSDLTAQTHSPPAPSPSAGQ